MRFDGSDIVAIILVGFILFVAFTSVKAVIATDRQRRRQILIRNGQCADCGYDLRESADVCPECGVKPNLAERTRAASEDLDRLHFMGLHAEWTTLEAIRLSEIILRHSTNATELNHAAWLLAAAKDFTLQDPKKARLLAERACEITDYTQASCLDTLAVSCAACEQFDDAIRYVEMAIGHCNGPERAGCLRRLELFRGRQPYFE
jgi:hypothetical protein